jgi:cytochrome c oxidase assembly protein subunit 15
MSQTCFDPAAQATAQQARPLAVARWLLVVAALIFSMVFVGGVTRLTESGLSITEWKPITGAIPPLSQQDWQSEFTKYRQIPEYTKINGPGGMKLTEFKSIYFWEWTHRLLGRLIGLVFAIPLIWFWLKKQIPAGFKLRLLLLFFLGGLQGAVGWWMVVSGLSVRTNVSHYRLATHLLLALSIIAALIWTALDLRRRNDGFRKNARITGFGIAVLVILFIELMLGAFTAGLHAGYVSNTWPLMYGKLIPPSITWNDQLLHTWSNHPIFIHFIHRWWAWVVVVMLTILARKVRKNHRRASLALHTAFGLQIALGISIVLSGVNMNFAVLHQSCATLVLVATVWCVHLLSSSTTAD